MDQFKKTHLRQPSKSDSNNSSENDKDDKFKNIRSPSKSRNKSGSDNSEEERVRTVRTKIELASKKTIVPPTPIQQTTPPDGSKSSSSYDSLSSDRTEESNEAKKVSSAAGPFEWRKKKTKGSSTPSPTGSENEEDNSKKLKKNRRKSISQSYHELPIQDDMYEQPITNKPKTPPLPRKGETLNPGPLRKRAFSGQSPGGSRANTIGSSKGEAILAALRDVETEGVISMPNTPVKPAKQNRDIKGRNVGFEAGTKTSSETTKSGKHRIKRRSHSYQSMTTFLDDDEDEEDQDMILRRSRDLTKSSFSMHPRNGLSSESIAKLQGTVIANLQANNTKMTRSMSGSSNDSNEDISIKPGKSLTAALQLSPSQSSGSISSSPSVSSTKEQQEQQIKQKKHIQYSFVLIEILLDPINKYELIRELCREVFEKEEESEQFGEAMINFFEANSKLVPLLQQLIAEEIENTNSINVLFRGETPALRLLSTFLKKAGGNYLQQLIKPTVTQILDNNFESLDTGSFQDYAIVNPLSSSSYRDLMNSPSMNSTSGSSSVTNILSRFPGKEKILSLTDSLIDRISNSTHKCPKSIRAILQFIHQKVSEKFPESQFLTVGGILFLRFICPAIVNPAKYKIIEESATTTVSSNRYLVAASKLVQTFVNSLISNEDINDDRSIVNKMVQSIRGYAADIISSTSNLTLSANLLNNNIEDSPDLLSELVAKVTSPSIPNAIIFDVPRDVYDFSLLVIRQCLEKYYDNVRATLLKLEELSHDNLRSINLNNLKEALDGLAYIELQSGSGTPLKGKSGFRNLIMGKDKPQRVELQKQLEQEREARKFYETVQRELLARVFDLRGIVEEERRKNESRKKLSKERKHVKEQIRQFEAENTIELPSFDSKQLSISTGTISDEESDTSESDMMLQYYRALVQRIHLLIEENQRLRESNERSLMQNEEQRERFNIRSLAFVEQYENLKLKLEEERRSTIDTMEKENQQIRDELQKERKAFIRNLKLRDEQEKIRQKLKDELQQGLQSLQKENQRIHEEMDKTIKDKDAQKKIEVDKLTEENNKLREQVNLLKSQLTEQTKTNLQLSSQLRHAKGEMRDGVIVGEDSNNNRDDRIAYFKERKSNSASDMSSKVRPLSNSQGSSGPVSRHGSTGKKKGKTFMAGSIKKRIAQIDKSKYQNDPLFLEFLKAFDQGKTRKQHHSGSSQDNWGGQSSVEGHLSSSPLDEDDAEHSHLMSILHSPSMDSLHSSDLDLNELQNNPYMKLLQEINNEAQQYLDEEEEDDEIPVRRGRPVYSRKNSIKKKEEIRVRARKKYSDEEEEDESTEEESIHEPLDEESQAEEEEEEQFEDNSDDSDAEFYNQQKYIRELKQTLTRSLSNFQGVDRDLLATSSSNLYNIDNPYESKSFHGQLPGLGPSNSASSVSSPSGKGKNKPKKIKRIDSNLYDKKKCIIQ